LSFVVHGDGTSVNQCKNKYSNSFRGLPHCLDEHIACLVTRGGLSETIHAHFRLESSVQKQNPKFDMEVEYCSRSSLLRAKSITLDYMGMCI
jgi:hypothetical protein